METIKKELWESSWAYIETVVDVVRHPILVLDKDLRVMLANEPFYRAFQVESKDTEGQVVYRLGNGQWNIPSLRRLLEEILPKNTFFKGFEVAHTFPFIGKKVMILNARRVSFKEPNARTGFPPIILLAFEDVTEVMIIAETLATHAKQVETKLTQRTQKLEMHIKKLEKEIGGLKKNGKSTKRS